MPLSQLLKKKFYSPISAMTLPQLGCHNFFFFPPYFGNAIVTISLSQFFPPILAMPLPQPQLVCHHFFFPLFRQWYCHNYFATIFFSPVSVMALPQTNCKIFFNDTCTQFLQQILSARLLLLD